MHFLFKKDSELTKENYALYSDGPIQWPKKLSAFYYHSDDNKYGKDEEYTRADSGVGESVIIFIKFCMPNRHVFNIFKYMLCLILGGNFIRLNVVG